MEEAGQEEGLGEVEAGREEGQGEVQAGREAGQGEAGGPEGEDFIPVEAEAEGGGQQEEAGEREGAQQ